MYLSEPLHIGSAAPRDIAEPGINPFIPQFVRGGIGFEVLHLRTDAKLGRFKGQPRFAPLRHPKAAEIVLRKSDRRAFPDDVRIYDMPHRHKAENNDLLEDAHPSSYRCCMSPRRAEHVLMLAGLDIDDIVHP